MGLKIWGRKILGLKICAVWLCAAVIAVTAFASPPAEAAAKKRVAANRSEVVPSRPRARITVPARSFLDAGTRVLPGERKFTDYALPPGYSPVSVIDNRAGSHRGPLPGPFDLPGRDNPWPWHWCSGC